MKYLLARFRHILLILTYPILKIAEKLGKPEAHVTAEFYYLSRKMLQPGDILLSKEDLKTLNILIPGFWSHAAIYVGKAKFDETIVEAIGRGVVQTPLVEWILKKDHVAVLRFRNTFAAEGEEASAYAISQEGKPYDYQIQPGTKAWYCAELVWGSWNKAMHGKCPLKPTPVLGVDAITPESIWDHAQPADELGENILQIITLFNGPK